MTSINSYSHNVSGEKDFGFAQAIKAGDTIYISGQLSHDADGEFIGANDFDTQINQIWANLQKVLDHFGITRNHIVQDSVFVVDLPQHAASVAGAHLAYFGDHRPTSTTVGVQSLFFPGQLVEISFVARTEIDAQ